MLNNDKTLINTPKINVKFAHSKTNTITELQFTNTAQSQAYIRKLTSCNTIQSYVYTNYFFVLFVLFIESFIYLPFHLQQYFVF